MSTDYYAARTQDAESLLSAVRDPKASSLPVLNTPSLVGALLDRLPGLTPFAMDHAAIAELEGISEEQARARYPSTELNWEDPTDRGYVQVVVHSTHVVVHMGGGASSLGPADTVLEALEAEGLRCFDPQQDCWIPQRPDA